MPETIKTSRSGGAFRVELHRPGCANAYNLLATEEIRAAFLEANAATDIFAVVLSGGKRNFCSGADLTWLSSADSEQSARAMAGSIFEMYESILRCELPVLAVVEGNTMGGGVGLVAACDLVSAHNAAKFSLSEVKWGLVPGIISPIVEAKIGIAAHRDLALLGKKIGASEALALGLVTSCGEDPNAQIEKWLLELGENSRIAMKAIKRASRERNPILTPALRERLISETTARWLDPAVKTKIKSEFS